MADVTRCPVCGFLGEPPEDHSICPCCGTQFAYHDSGPLPKLVYHLKLRRIWVDTGMKWWSKVHNPPIGWDPQAQLRVLEAE